MEVPQIVRADGRFKTLEVHPINTGDNHRQNSKYADGCDGFQNGESFDKAISAASRVEHWVKS